jgi:hypothetical protein
MTQLAELSIKPPRLVQALEALARRNDHSDDAHDLLEELCGITVLVAKRYTNERTADGLLEAFQLTVGCISLAISKANLPDDGDTQLSFLLSQGAEVIFQKGFRHIKELSALPYTPFLSAFDDDPFVQQRDIKMLFTDLCRADPASTWEGDLQFQRELLDRTANARIVRCAQWLRQKHYAGPVKDPDLDAHAVVSIAVIFAIAGDGRIVARVGQREIENLIRHVRKERPDIDAGWKTLLESVPEEFHPVLRECMDEYRNSIIKKIFSRTAIKSVVTEIQDFYAGSELEVEYD